MNPWLIVYLLLLCLCLVDNLDRLIWARKLRRMRINSRLKPRFLDWVLALVPPAYVVRRARLWR